MGAPKVIDFGPNLVGSVIERTNEMSGGGSVENFPTHIPDAIIQAIADNGPVSRANVSKVTGLSKQTVSEIVSNLESAGWVRTVGQTEGHVGRRAVVYEISRSAATIVSVDLGGTKVRVALCDLTGSAVSEAVEPTEPSGGIRIVEQISRMVLKDARSARIPRENFRIAVVGVPGVPEPRTGGVQLSPNIVGIDEINLRGGLEERLGIETFVENDVNLAAIG